MKSAIPLLSRGNINKQIKTLIEQQRDCSFPFLSPHGHSTSPSPSPSLSLVYTLPPPPTPLLLSPPLHLRNPLGLLPFLAIHCARMHVRKVHQKWVLLGASRREETPVMCVCVCVCVCVF